MIGETVSDIVTELTTPLLPARAGGWGLKACLLIRLDARLGEEVSVLDLADHLAVHPGVVREELELLAAQGQLDVTRGPDQVITHATVDSTKHKGLTR